jgi:hypothetical protein
VVLDDCDLMIEPPKGVAKLVAKEYGLGKVFIPPPPELWPRDEEVGLLISSEKEEDGEGSDDDKGSDEEEEEDEDEDDEEAGEGKGEGGQEVSSDVDDQMDVDDVNDSHVDHVPISQVGVWLQSWSDHNSLSFFSCHCRRVGSASIHL